MTAAHFAASLHQLNTSKLAKAVTPLEANTAVASLRDTSVMILSAGGRNPDIIGALKRAIACEPARIIVVCSQSGSPLAELAAKYRSVDVTVFDLPTGKDGFLATNSLLAVAVILARAYADAYATSIDLPATLVDLVHPRHCHAEYAESLRDSCLPLWARENLIVLYGTAAQAAAFDAESKFTEAALGALQLADYRNFAHGRHHWLAKRSDATAVLAFVTEEDAGIADRTLRLLPENIPTARLEVPHEGVAAGLAAMVRTLYVVKFAGEARGIDPGRPGVPAFGRKIYNLRAFGSSSKRSEGEPLEELTSIERKAGVPLVALQEKNDLTFWKDAYREFSERIQSASFCALVCDYDGTLCDGRDRFNNLDKEVAAQLTRLLDDGLLIGIATGRGKSVKEVMRAALPKRLWSRVHIGYYNGGEVASLDIDAAPDGTAGVCDALKLTAEVLQANYVVRRNSECSYRRTQITVVPRTPAVRELVWRAVQQLVNAEAGAGASVLRSSHSIDVIAPGVTKRRLLAEIKDGYDGKATAVLCIGDRGQFPGNDFDLLREPFSLSVDETSSDPATCWNLAPRGFRGVQAAIYYLQALQRTAKGVRFSPGSDKAVST